MKKIPTKEQNIKKAGRIQKIMRLYAKANSLLKSGKNIEKSEKRIDTMYGVVRVLCYGFSKQDVTPVFFDLHGGGFVLGNAEMDEAINLEIMQKTGCKVVSIDYAKAPDYPFPHAIEQIYAVITHFHARAEQYGIDRNALAIGGHSAGANLSTVICMKAKTSGIFNFRCQILDYPVLDLATDPYAKPLPKGCIPPGMALMFNDCYVDADKAQEPYVSPVYATVEQLRNLPPACMILAGKDSLYSEGKEYAQKLKEAEVPITLYEYENSKHGFTYKNSKERNDAVGKMIEFLKTFYFLAHG